MLAHTQPKACLAAGFTVSNPRGQQATPGNRNIGLWFMDDGYNRVKNVIIVRGITENSPIFAKYIVFIGDGWLFADDEMNGNFIKNTLTR